MYFWTADSHLGHKNVITFCQRPFKTVWEMDEEIIRRHNEVVKPEDTVVVAGDFTLHSSREFVQRTYINRMNGHLIFLRGSHDKWLNGTQNIHEIHEVTINKQVVVACHYCMRTWPRSHYSSWLAYGHSHGRLPPEGKQWDVGVDNNNFYPVSFDQLAALMAKQPPTQGDLRYR